MDKFIVCYIFISIILFFCLFCYFINMFKKEVPCSNFIHWYLDEWVVINVITSVLWPITIPFIVIVWCFIKVCKIIMKICKVE